MFKDKDMPNLPFVLRKVNKDKKYLACKIGVCFAYSTKFNNIVKDIKKEAILLK
jgi:hypothetical protein